MRSALSGVLSGVLVMILLAPVLAQDNPPSTIEDLERDDAYVGGEELEKIDLGQT